MAAAVTMWLLPFLCSHWTLQWVSSALCCRPPTWVCYLLCLKCHVNAFSAHLFVSSHLPPVAMATHIFVWIMAIKRRCVCRMKWKASISQIALTSRVSLVLGERVCPKLVEKFPPFYGNRRWNSGIYDEMCQLCKCLEWDNKGSGFHDDTQNKIQKTATWRTQKTWWEQNKTGSVGIT